MSLEAEIANDLKKAMKSKDQAALRSVRAIKAAILLIKTDGSGNELNEDSEIKLLQKLVNKANNPAFPIRLSAITIGSDTSARATFDAMTSLTGGANYSTATAAGVSTAITEAINDLAESTRFPRLEATVLKPKFTFPESISPASDDPPTSIVLQLQKMDLAKSIWKSYSTVTLPATDTSWIPAKALPVGLYGWRLTYKFDAGTLRDPSGGVLETSCRQSGD